MINSTVVITQVAQFNRNVVTFNAQGALGIGVPGSSTTVDLKMVDDNFLTGGALIVKGATFGDFCDVQVVDLDGTVAPAGTVLSQFITSWFMNDGSSKQAEFDLPYPAKIYAGLYIRLIYNSVAAAESAAPRIAVNYNLHKALI